MKKRFILGLAALAALALTGCQKDLVVNQVPEETPIAFGTYLGRDAATKAEVLNLGKLKEYGFGVYAYYHVGNWQNDASLVANFMSNEKVDYDETNSRWKYTNVKYWPQIVSDEATQKKISFFAYAPYNSNTTYVASSTTGEPTITVSKGTDHTYATVGSTMTSLKNLTSQNLVDGKVHFNFKHAMSKVGISIQAKDQLGNSLGSNSSITVTSLSIKFSNVYKTATLNLGSGDLNCSDDASNKEDFTLSLTSLSNNAVINNANSKVTNNESDYLMLVPQENISLTINVSYTIKTTDSNLPVNNQDISFSYTVTNNTNTITIEKGKAYNLALTLGLNAIEFCAKVTDWETPIDIPQNGITL